MKSDIPPNNDLHAVLQRLVVEVFKGAKHGHFEITVTGDANKNGHRNITIKSGLTHRYSMHINDIPQSYPNVTFQPKALLQSAQTMATSPPDAHTGKDITNEPKTK